MPDPSQYYTAKTGPNKGTVYTDYNAYTGYNKGQLDPVSATPQTGTLNPPTVVPPTPPVSTAQPNPATVNATPYTSSSFYLPETPEQGFDPNTVFNDKGEGLSSEQYAAQGGAADFSNVSKVPALQQALAAAKKSGPAPQTAGEAAGKVSGAINNANKGQPTDFSGIEAQLAEDKGYQQLLADRAEYNNVVNQNKSLADEYKSLIKESGIEQINTDLINAKNILEGTSDDIRNEITKAGGFGSESAVQALTLARNKSLIKNYNNLLDQKQMAMESVNTMIGLASQDRDFALQSISQKLQIDQEIIKYRDNMNTKAAEQYKYLADKIGFDGLLAQTGGDPYYTSLIENTLGLGAGGLQKIVTEQKQQQNLSNYENYNISSPYIITATGEVQDVKTGTGFSSPEQFQQATGMSLDQAGQKGLIKPLGLNKKDSQQQFSNQIDLAQLDLQQQQVNTSKQNAAISAGNLGLARQKFQYDQLKDLVDAGKLDDATIGKIQASPDYKTISGLLPAVQAIKTYKDLIQKEGTYAMPGSAARGQLQSAYGNAIAAWKTLAGLGALSGADFALAENAIPSLGLFKSNTKATATLQGSLDNAIQQAQNLSARLSQLYPKGTDLINSQLDNMLATAYPEKYKVGPDGKVYEITR